MDPLVAILAGGRGSRLGGAKATVELAGRPLISYPLAAAAAAGLEAIVVAKPKSELPRVDCRVVREPARPRHPLCGIVAALREAAGRPVLAIACDMVLIEPGLLAHLAAAPEPLVVPAPGGRLQPLAARYGPELAPDLEATLRREEPLRRSVEALSPRLLGDEELARFGEPERMLLNVNDREELREAERLLAARQRGR